MAPDQLKEVVSLILKEWGVYGAVFIGLLVYHKPILAALQRTTRDPLIEALAEQNRHFAANNGLFLGLGPELQEIKSNTARAADASELAAERLAELLSVQRGIEKELIRRGGRT